MNIQQFDPTVSDLVAGYQDDGYDGVVDFAGKLNRFYVRGDRKYARIVIHYKDQSHGRQNVREFRD